MELIMAIGGGVVLVLRTVGEALAKSLPKAFSFIMWVLAGLIILPCVYVAGNLFEPWKDWGEKTF